MGKISAKVYKYQSITSFEIEEYYEPEKKQENIEAVQLAFTKAGEKQQELCRMTASEDVKQAEIFEAQLCILEDKYVRTQIIDMIEQESVNADYAIAKVFDQYIEGFGKSNEVMLTDKILDLLDIKRKLLEALRDFEVKDDSMLQINEDVILVAQELLPSDLLAMNPEHIKGIIIEKGSQLSHVAILAKTRGIPIITEAEGIWESIEDGQTIEVNFAQEETILDVTAQLGGMIGLNVDDSDWKLANADYDFIGLYRTEVYYMQMQQLPTEEELYQNYKRALERAGDRPITFRTIDIGGDKTLPYMRTNGFRGMEFCFVHSDVFQTQLRAILRASAFGKAKLMFPMVKSIEDIRLAKHHVQEVMKELEQEGIAFDKKLCIGVMIETCEITKVINQVVNEVDFASVGTNDLLEAVTGVPRMKMQGNAYKMEMTESLFTILEDVFCAFTQAKKAIYVCGEMAASPEYAKRFIELGATGLSMNWTDMASVRSVLHRGAIEEI